MSPPSLAAAFARHSADICKGSGQAVAVASGLALLFGQPLVPPRAAALGVAVGLCLVAISYIFVLWAVRIERRAQENNQ